MNRRPEQIFFQRRYTDGQQTHEKMLNINHLGIQIKITMRYHLILIRMAIIRTTNNTFCEIIEKKEFLHTVAQNVHWCSHNGKQNEISLKKVKMKLLYVLANSIFGYLSKENKTLILRDTHPSVHHGILYNSQDMKST